jgi:uncharacterized protein (TIGR00299 family) protein
MACGALADLSGQVEVGSQVAGDLGLGGVRVEVVSKDSFGISGKGFEVTSSVREEVPRNLETIKTLFEESNLPGDVVANSIRAFTRLAEAESHIHGVPPGEVHFHEVGAIDSIIDVATFFYYLYLLKPEIIYCSELPPGMGSVKTAHGTYPLPAPATLELLKGTGAVFRQVEFQGEAVTPTGAALIISAGAKFQQMPSFTVTGAGYGVGRMVIPERPNILRAIWGEALFSPSKDRVVIMETNVDDMNPQHVEILMERMFEIGALDFFVTPVQMKKNRPGWLFTAILGEQDVGGALSALFSVTTTTGVRITETERVKLQRSAEQIETSFGPVSVKVIEYPEGWKRAVPEYEDIKKIAKVEPLSLGEIVKEVERAWRKGK